jgi:APA family basic amino acid/polyamine antiporter
MEATPNGSGGTGSKVFGGWFRTKPLDAILKDAEEPEHQLKRALGPVQLTLFGIGAIIGAGIFATIGTAAAGDAQRPGAGPALIVSFVLTAVVCSFTALCYAEFASMVPISGSAYTYSYATLGELIAWIIGWDLIIEYAVGNIAVAISWANYFKTFVKGFGIIIPDWQSLDYRTAAKLQEAAEKAGEPGPFDLAPHLFGYPIVMNLLAVAIVAVITVVLVWGIRESARFNAVMVAIKILVLTFFIIIGALWVKPDNWSDFAPKGWAGISAGAAVVFFAYIGFDAISTVAEETTDPQRNLPIGILASLILCTVFYVLVSVVFTGLISYEDLKAKMASEQAEPLTMALEHVSANLGWAVGIVAFGSVIAHTAVLLVFQLGQPRIFFAMARDGLLPAAFGKVHPRFRTPHISTILTGIFVAGFAAFASIDEMVDLTNIGTLFAFILVCAGIIVLRIKEPDRPRPFRVPGGYLFPVFGILSCLYLVYYLPPTSWLRFAAWLNFGFVIYVGYGASHSRLAGRQHSASPAAHDARTARLGAGLALLGVILLLLTHAFDVGLAAYEKLQDESAPFAQEKDVMQAVFNQEAWLKPSWFLIVPLALNAFVLCPIIAFKALKAHREIGGNLRSGRTIPSLIMATSLAVATLIYLILIRFHRSA